MVLIKVESNCLRGSSTHHTVSDQLLVTKLCNRKSTSWNHVHIIHSIVQRTVIFTLASRARAARLAPALLNVSTNTLARSLGVESWVNKFLPTGYPVGFTITLKAGE